MKCCFTSTETVGLLGTGDLCSDCSLSVYTGFVSSLSVLSVHVCCLLHLCPSCFCYLSVPFCQFTLLALSPLYTFCLLCPSCYVTFVRPCLSVLFVRSALLAVCLVSYVRPVCLLMMSVMSLWSSLCCLSTYSYLFSLPTYCCLSCLSTYAVCADCPLMLSVLTLSLIHI